MKLSLSNQFDPVRRGPVINLEKGAGFETEDSDRDPRVMVKCYVCGEHAIKVLWDVKRHEQVCQLLEVDGVKKMSRPEWSDYVDAGSVLNQELLALVIKNAGIDAVADIKEIAENIYIKMDELGRLASHVK